MPHAGRLAAFLEQWRGAFAREQLPPPPPDVPAPSPRGFLHLLLTIEPLSSAPPAAPPRRGLLAAVFGPEELPRETEAAPRHRLPWLTWLFAPEPIDGDSSGPEVR